MQSLDIKYFLITQPSLKKKKKNLSKITAVKECTPLLFQDELMSLH